jgi:hypothetical protein
METQLLERKKELERHLTKLKIYWTSWLVFAILTLFAGIGLIGIICVYTLNKRIKKTKEELAEVNAQLNSGNTHQV